MEIVPFPQTQHRCSICQFEHSLCPTPQSGAGEGARSPCLSGNVLLTPSWAEGESDIFLGLSGQLAWPPCRAAFREAGQGRSKGTFGPSLHPVPRAHRRELQLLATSCPHMSLNIQGKRSPLENHGKLRATEWRLCGDLVPTPRGPGDRRGRGAAGAASAGRARGCGASRSCPGSRARAADRGGSRARQEEGAPAAAAAAACPACPRPGSRSLPTNSARRPAAPPPRAPASVWDCAAAAQVGAAAAVTRRAGPG